MNNITSFISETYISGSRCWVIRRWLVVIQNLLCSLLLKVISLAFRCCYFFQILAVIFHFSQPLSRIFKPDITWQSFCIFWYWVQAHLMALLHLSNTSSSWLKAIPQVCLGLAIPRPEFIFSLPIWLGVSLFSLSPLCTCLSIIDNFGDHLLGCSQGPMRIHRHDAQVNVIYNALSQDHPLHNI